MRQTIYSLLVNDPILAEHMGDRWIQASATHGEDDQAAGIARPFGAFRLSGTFAGMGQTNTKALEIWIHDETGSFLLIDKLLSRVREIVEALEQVQNPTTGNWIQEATWISFSPDLFDDARRTNTRMASFTLVGTGA